MFMRLGLWGIAVAAVAPAFFPGIQAACAQCQLAKLLPTDGDGQDEFGFSAAIFGDYAIVGAPKNDDAGESSGAAYVFRRTGSNWIQKSKLTAPDAAEFDFFGASVAISGDYAVVSAVLDDEAASNAGALYVFHRNVGAWVFEDKLLASDAGEDDELGTSVAISGNYIIAGARNDDAGASSGCAYVFLRNGVNWTQQAKLTASDAAAGDEFGSAVSISGDYVVIGAPLDNVSQNDTGSAYVFKRNGTTWSQQTRISASDAAEGNEFGRSVSISGDYVIVGARLADLPTFNNAGAAYVFKRNGTLWPQQAKLTADDLDDDDLFGVSVSISGDYALIGSWQDDDGGTNSGSAYVFKRNGTTWLQTTKLTALDGAPGDLFGFSVSMSGGYALVAAPQDDDFGLSSGSAYVFGAAKDCNGNNSPDACDIQDGTSRDGNADGIPDECGMTGGDFDFDNDGDVDFRDVREFQSCYNRTGAMLPGCNVFDAEPDGDVDLDDYAILQAALTGP